MTNNNGENLIVSTESYYLYGYRDLHNKRLKIEDFRGDVLNIINQIQSWGNDSNVEKIIIKTRKEFVKQLLEVGFLLEAVVPGYFLGSDMYFLCKYNSSERYNSEWWCDEDTILGNVRNRENKGLNNLDSSLILRIATKDDAERLSNFYSSVFSIYPVPIDQPSYIEEQIDTGTIFMLMEEKGYIIAAASAEINNTYKNAEITDCATLPGNRKGGYMNHIIRSLEKELLNKQIYCSYSIARSLSFGMNAVLQNLHYTYTGRLKNNCYIFDKMEDMNVWYKDLTNKNAKNLAILDGN
ncbi:putative beta-lysine N-acetyltransferase [Sutcliffiella rhizosphaerae]|uniref:N-acetyltransferase YodP n=1 Tax=Sutcliffiella rhizosphaerae TaxID=2880967 RepID=A0ABN8AFL9_9BACI|nr:putative beta-lysine N-acetyltransferase [Sutcliffiella rhizosphaerae]CAG9621963.1 N-acetyltransferase YodP [Sutcliffiella rhizosphaerae]